MGARCCQTKATPKRTQKLFESKSKRKGIPRSRCKVGPCSHQFLSVTPSEIGVKYPPVGHPFISFGSCLRMMQKNHPPPFKLGKSQKIPPTLTFTQQQQNKKQPQQTPKANCRPEVWTNNFLTLGLPNSRQHSIPSCHLLDEAIKATASTGRSEPPNLSEVVGFWGVPKLAASQKKTGCKWWLPSTKLTYPTLGKGNSSSKLPWKGIC